MDNGKRRWTDMISKESSDGHMGLIIILFSKYNILNYLFGKYMVLDEAGK